MSLLMELPFQGGDRDETPREVRGDKRYSKGEGLGIEMGSSSRASGRSRAET